MRLFSKQSSALCPYNELVFFGSPRRRSLRTNSSRNSMRPYSSTPPTPGRPERPAWRRSTERNGPHRCRPHGFHLATTAPLDKRIGYGFLVSNEQGRGIEPLPIHGTGCTQPSIEPKPNLRSGQLALVHGALILTTRFHGSTLRDNAATSAETPTDRGRNYWTRGGIHAASRRTWLGMSANHLLSPNASLNPAAGKLSVLYTVHVVRASNSSTAPRSPESRCGVVLEARPARGPQPA